MVVVAVLVLVPVPIPLFVPICVSVDVLEVVPIPVLFPLAAVLAGTELSELEQEIRPHASIGVIIPKRNNALKR